MKVFFKPITRLTVLSLLLTMSLGAYAQPANDLCANAITVTCGQTVTGNTDAATIDTPPACGLTFPRYGVWYRFNGTGQMVTLSTCSATTNYDTQIGVYSGSCTSLVCVAGNNNDAACSTNGRFSTVTFTSTPGTTYFIWVTGVLSSRGSYALSVSCTGGVTVPNDLCDNATLMSCGSTVTGSTANATIDNVATCTTTLNTAPGVWYRFVGNGGSTTVSTCNPGTDFDTKLGVFSGSCASLTCIGGNDDTTAPECVLPSTGFNRKSRVTFQSTAGVTYYVLVTGFSTNTGNYELSVTCDAPPVPTNNDECVNAITLVPGATCNPTSGNNLTATQSVAPISCDGFTSSSSLDVWYKFVATGSTHTVIVNGGTTLDVIADVRSGACNGSTIGCSDDQILSGNPEIVALTGLTAGQTYLVRVYGWFGAQGNFTICVTNGSTTLSQDNTNAPAQVIFGDNGNKRISEFFPNPAQFDNTNVKIYALDESKATIVLHDNVGRLVFSQEVELAGGVNEVALNLNQLAIGSYFATIDLNGEIFRRKLVIVR